MPRVDGPASDPLERSTLSEESAPSSARGSRALVPALTILYHREPRRIGERALLTQLAAGQAVALSRTQLSFMPVHAPMEQGQPLAEPRVSREPVWLRPGASGGLQLIVENSRARVRYRGTAVTGAHDISAAELLDGGVLELGGAVALVLHLSQRLESPNHEGSALIGFSHHMHAVRADLRRLAGIDVPVLIRGETGTGKELAAQMLHALSARADRPFVAVNLGAIPPSLAAGELFGAERGAFTGAAGRQLGYFQQARSGTLFLDELGEAPPEVQVVLLRAIETGEIRALGAGAVQKVQARLIAATDADLEKLIREKQFRLPLMHRLSTCELHLPALRQRREDIGVLFLHFLRLECAAQGRPFLLDRPDAETAPWLPMRLLVQLAMHDWPGNVRQLRNVVRQVVLADEHSVSLELPSAFADIQARGSMRSQEEAPALSQAQPARRRPADVSEAELINALEKSRWDLKATAAALGIARPSLYMLLDKAPHIRTARSLTAEELARSHRECGGDLDAMSARLRISLSALRRRLRELQLE